MRVNRVYIHINIVYVLRIEIYFFSVGLLKLIDDDSNLYSRYAPILLFSKIRITFIDDEKCIFFYVYFNHLIDPEIFFNIIIT